ncbi:MAG: hypothetical protein K9K66_01930 [Desulfarculaceae bacterium]|nr:hypothetical protein [Desulfarculaceae bacterium]MCF8073460.1 hypothetical protein [Desulfarculaceae bacterium]MCF8100393.1 hypothetical protein [Desulfarculaceae bacterium]MCF8115871.1 hypothetical protein [Desulfarculaceae bacterium]
MARRLSIAAVLLVISAALMAAGCGVKASPKPSSQLAPIAPGNVLVKPVPAGMEITFDVPSAPTPARAVEEIRIYYGYLPLTGDPACPPCPPHLRKFHRFTLSAKPAKQGQPSSQDGGLFVYVDRSAPVDREALYQVMLIDASGRKSGLSALARMPRLLPAAPPARLTATPGDGEVVLAWDEVKLAADGRELDDITGYIVMRKGPEGAKQLNERPITEAGLIDKTVVNGKFYSYRVYAARGFGKMNLPGQGSAWAKVQPSDQMAPKPPTDLAAASSKDGVYLRFTPSASPDAAGYLVFRKGKQGSWAPVTEELLVENVFVDKKAKAGEAYYYRIQAVDESGNASEFSEELEIVHQP